MRPRIPQFCPCLAMCCTMPCSHQLKLHDWVTARTKEAMHLKQAPVPPCFMLHLVGPFTYIPVCCLHLHPASVQELCPIVSEGFSLSTLDSNATHFKHFRKFLIQIFTPLIDSKLSLFSISLFFTFSFLPFKKSFYISFFTFHILSAFFLSFFLPFLSFIFSACLPACLPICLPSFLPLNFSLSFFFLFLSFTSYSFPLLF